MILITGATGNIGKELIPILSKTAQPIRVLVRDEKKVAHLDSSIERIVGDLNDPEDSYPCHVRCGQDLPGHFRNPAGYQCDRGRKTSRRTTDRQAFDSGGSRSTKSK